MNISGKLFLKVWLAFLAVGFFALLLIACFSWFALVSFYKQTLTQELTKRAEFVGQQVTRGETSLNSQQFAALSEHLAQLSDTRVTILDSKGNILSGSGHFDASTDNLKHRPEVQTALGGGRGVAVRQNQREGGKEMIHVALQIPENGDKGRVIVRTSTSMAALRAASDAFLLKFLQGAAVSILVGAGAAFIVARRLTLPVAQVAEKAERMAQGELSTQIYAGGSQEVVKLSAAVNEMGKELQRRIFTISERHNELEIILNSMVEGLIAVNENERLMRMNPAARQICNVREDEQVQGCTMQAVIRHSELQQVVSEILVEENTEIQKEFTLYEPNEKYIRANGTLLQDSEGRRVGAVVVLNDITQLQRFENMRKAFVSNVSHELRSPLTSIKGFVETLIDGAISKPEDAQRFLTIVHQQTARLETLVEDLLLLSKIENVQDLDEGLDTSRCSLRVMLHEVVELYKNTLKEKGITLRTAFPEKLSVDVNSNFLQQAIGNLISNAATYCAKGSTVWIEAYAGGDVVSISVTDNGPGIPETHLPYVFQRFYRVDKSRSREKGGTGLGLAITKHIVQLHGGDITVESTVGQGTSFRIQLPVYSGEDGSWDNNSN